MASENGQNLEVSVILLHAGADVENPDKKGLGFFKYSFQPVLHNWCNKDRCMCYFSFLPVLHDWCNKTVVCAIFRSSQCSTIGVTKTVVCAISRSYQCSTTGVTKPLYVLFFVPASAPRLV